MTNEFGNQFGDEDMFINYKNGAPKPKTKRPDAKRQPPLAPGTTGRKSGMLRKSASRASGSGYFFEKYLKDEVGQKNLDSTIGSQRQQRAGGTNTSGGSALG